MTTSDNVRETLKRLPKGRPITLATFKKCGSATSVRQAVVRLANQGELVRLRRGVYARPKPVKHLKTQALADPNAVAKVIAARNHETLAPHGSDLARSFGLTTQQSVQPSFYTTGRTRKMKVVKQTLAFEHAPTYLIDKQHSPAGQALLALHYLGPEQINQTLLERVRQRIGADAFEDVAKDKLRPWMRDVVVKLEKLHDAR